MKTNKEINNQNLVLNINDLQTLTDSFFKATNLGVSITDMNQNTLIQSGWQKICTQFHQKNNEAHKGCIESNQYFKQNIKENEPVSYRCKNGLWDIAYPIVVENEMIAIAYFGQFFYNDEVIDKHFFIKQAEKFDFNKEEYLRALKEVPILSREKVDGYIKLYISILNMSLKQS